MHNLKSGSSSCITSFLCISLLEPFFLSATNLSHRRAHEGSKYQYRFDCRITFLLALSFLFIISPHGQCGVVFASVEAVGLKDAASSKEQDKLVRYLSHLPVIPTDFGSDFNGDEREKSGSISSEEMYSFVPPEIGKHIPRIIWIAVKNKSEPLPDHMYRFFSRNPQWKVRIVGNDDKDRFIDTIYGNTSVAWAYRMINPLLGAAKADIWRLAILYRYGGVYIDDDSDVKTPLDEIIQLNDKIIVSEEGIDNIECFYRSYKLSGNQTFTRYDKDLVLKKVDPIYLDGLDKSTGHPRFFHGKYILNWLIMSAPRQTIFSRTLENIVEILRREYFMSSVILIHKRTPRFRLLLCATNYVMTSTFRDLILEEASARPSKVSNKTFHPRISRHDFREYGGTCKAIWTGNDPNNYRKVMMRNKIGAALVINSTADYSEGITQLEGNAIIADAGGRSIFLVKDGFRVPFNGFEVFSNLGYDLDDVLYISDELFNAIPLNDALILTRNCFLQ